MLDQVTIESILDTSCPFDEKKIQILDVLVQRMLTGSNDEKYVAHGVLSKLKANPEAWRLVGIILQLSSSVNTQFFALSILEECIATRWNILPEEQKAGIKQYITDMVIKTSTNETIENSKYIITKVNKTLIQIVKQEWPYNWSSFIPDLCSAAKTNQNICENSLRILNLLSEEIFDFGKDHLVSRKVSIMMTTLNSQFEKIYDLCMFVLQNSVESYTSVKSSLVVVTLECLAHFLKWIPYEYIFDTGLIDILMQYFWDPTYSRIECVKCLSEIASLKNIPPNGIDKLGNNLWIPLINKLQQLSDLTMEYESRNYVNSKIFWESFYLQLSICLTTFLKNNRETICEVYPKNQNSTDLVVFSFRFLVKIMTKINHDETFKICVYYWNNLSESLLTEVRTAHAASLATVQNNYPPLSLGDSLEDDNNLKELIPLESPEAFSNRLKTYQEVLNEVRHSLIMKMARPREVCIHYDEETGTVDRDYETDTDELALYNIMRETLIYLTNLGGTQTEEVMMYLLESFTENITNSNQEKWNPTVLSRLCWAIGSISGAMPEKRERFFLIFIIKKLLWLCEHKRGKENKSIVASMIMYVFGQYPRFLRSCVLFLETVISKLFEFLQETFPGVQDMAAETFLKISMKCASTMAVPQGDKTKSYIEVILPQLPALYSQLPSPKQQLMLYEGVGHIIAAVPNQANKQMYIVILTKMFNDEWAKISSYLSENEISPALYEVAVARKLTEILRVNERICCATGTTYCNQFTTLYQGILNIYNLYSIRISQEISVHGPIVTSHTHVKALRSVKRLILLFVQSFVSSASSDRTKDANNHTFFSTGDTNASVRHELFNFVVPPLLEPVLKDYQSNHPQARDHEVLSLLTTLILKLDTFIVKELPQIFHLIFDCTLDMIKSDFYSFPDHRIKFYEFLEATNEKCFEALFSLPDIQQRYFVESLVWAFKHEEPSVAEQGLKITMSLLRNVSSAKNEIILSFHRAFFWRIFREILSVITDTLHKSGFQLQSLILMHLVQLVDSGVFENTDTNIQKSTVMECLAELLSQSFPNLNRTQIQVFVIGLFNESSSPQKFIQHLHDLLIQLKEFSGSDELFEAERQEALKQSEELALRRKMMIPGIACQYVNATTLRVDDIDF